MRFILYTEKTPAQALTAINTRMQSKESSARNSLGGWIEKNGAFSLNVATPVIGRFERRTVMRGRIERENGLTVVQGDVPHGVDKQGQLIVFIALALLGVLILTSGNAIALVMIPLGAYLYVPMNGDRANSEILMNELQRTLKARQTPPKKTDSKDAPRTSAARSTGSAKSASTTRSSGTGKPSATTRSTGTAKSTSTTRSTGTSRSTAAKSTSTSTARKTATTSANKPTGTSRAKVSSGENTFGLGR